MGTDIKHLKKRFIETLVEVSTILGIPVIDIKRDEYVRVTVDLRIQGRLNKVELNLLGGYKKAQKKYFNKGKPKVDKPKILVLDIETCPMQNYNWGIWDQNPSLEMVIEDWAVLSWSAKWLGDSPDKIVYMDTSKEKSPYNDKKILKEIWKLLDEADYVLGHNSDAFDLKRLNARFLLHGIKPPSSYRRFDTKKLAKKHFSLTSNKLAYITEKLCTKYVKLSHKEFPGFELWKECLKGNKKAWEEMKIYNNYDVLSLEEAFLKILPWESANLFSAYYDADINICTCGGIDFKKKGFYCTPVGKFQKLVCINCGSETRDSNNLLSKKKKKKIGRNTTR